MNSEVRSGSLALKFTARVEWEARDRLKDRRLFGTW